MAKNKNAKKKTAKAKKTKVKKKSQNDIKVFKGGFGRVKMFGKLSVSNAPVSVFACAGTGTITMTGT